MGVGEIFPGLPIFCPCFQCSEYSRPDALKTLKIENTKIFKDFSECERKFKQCRFFFLIEKFCKYKKKKKEKKRRKKKKSGKKKKKK